MQLQKTSFRMVGALVIALAMMTMFAAGSRAQESLPEPSTTIRVMNVAEGSPAADIAVDGEVRYSSLGYGEVTQYDSVTPGDHEFEITFPGDDSVAPITQSQTIEPGNAALVLIVNGDSGPEVQTYSVDLDRTSDGTARVRLINASPDAGELDVYGESDRWFKNVGNGSASDYKEVNYGIRDITVRNDDDDAPLVDAPQTKLNWGVVYDMVLFGNVADNTLQSITLTTTVSPRCTLLTPAQGLPGDACLRIGNLAPAGLPLVDIYYNNVRILENVGLGERLNYVAVPVYPYEVPIHVVQAGMGTDYSSTYRYVDLRPGEAYDMFIVGSATSPTIVAGRVNLTPPPVGQARWRMIQGNPDAPTMDIRIKDGATIFSEVNYKDVTDDIVLDSGAYTVQAIDHDSGEVLFESDVVLDPGMVYDSIVSYQVELTAGDTLSTPVAVTGTNSLIVTFSTPTFPRGGILIPEPADATTDVAADEETAE